MTRTLADCEAENEQLRMELEMRGQLQDDVESLDEVATADATARTERLKLQIVGLHVRVARLRAGLAGLIGTTQVLPDRPGEDRSREAVLVPTTIAAFRAARTALDEMSNVDA